MQPTIRATPYLDLAPVALIDPPRKVVRSPTFCSHLNPEDDLKFVNIEMKLLSPQNKDYHMYTLRHISRDVDSPEKLKAEIYKQCKYVVPSPQTMEIGFYLQSKKSGLTWHEWHVENDI